MVLVLCYKVFSGTKMHKEDVISMLDLHKKQIV